ncbi:DNA-binding response regulator, NarL/FixJ family, contains REC and HTH domains [Paenimyroides ummariense]|uniref:DNA-binding response regulator, NarL/FixJ family, contains REC and HTH domains n=1 Tax=Paenimyroides ummariense TaxID=913024 RepID=A0A1I5FG10_9FLAO|nr:response regulator [Paenimyroides ummariense]SFO22695.1 DNA-binding response regulator, NarL/FixJ family, contains REC and HTH domains [Paenimyroides ummariense]
MNFVLVDDHPFILEGYGNIIKQIYPQSKIIKLTTCKEVYDYFNTDPNAKLNDIALIDFNIPPYDEKNIKNGIDVAKLVRKVIPYCKIIILTAHTEKIFILDIIKNVKPEGFFTKGELTPENLKKLIENVLNHDKFYSDFVQETFNESLDDKSLIDDYNRQILYLLSKGYKIIELDKIIPISYSAIQKRIAKMKQVLNVQDDKGLVKAAIQHGYLS